MKQEYIVVYKYLTKGKSIVLADSREEAMDIVTKAGCCFHGEERIVSKRVVSGSLIKKGNSMNKEEVRRVLEGITKIGIKNVPVESDGHMNIKAFNKMPEMLKVKKELRALGVTSSKELTAMGFLAAGMVIKFN